MVILEKTSRLALYARERFFIRELRPVFNVRDLDDGWPLRSLGGSSVDDIVTNASRVLRQAHPRMTGK